MKTCLSANIYTIPSVYTSGRMSVSQKYGPPFAWHPKEVQLETNHSRGRKLSLHSLEPPGTKIGPCREEFP